MSKPLKWGVGIFVFICIMGAVVFSAGGYTWGNKDAGAAVATILFIATVAGGCVAASMAPLKS